MTSSEEKFSMESLLGPKLLTKVGAPSKPTAELMKGKELVALYFSASWCPPCKAFSPVLADFYKSCAEKSGLAIVYISSDKTVEEFEGYYSKMPYLAIPCQEGCAAIKNNLAQTLGIQGIPVLIVLDVQTGEFITASAREDVTKVGGDPTYGKELVAEWKAMERKPLSEATKALGGGQSPIMKIFLWLAKNPFVFFAIMYGYKWVKKQLKELSGDDSPVEDEPVIEQAYESEF
jgi:nucleoredoxin